jgi:hypothetical protein
VPTTVALVDFTADVHKLLWTFAGSGDVSSCTGGQLQAAGDDGDYHEPTSATALNSRQVLCTYADFFDPGNSAWIVQALPTGIQLNSSTFALPQAGFM